MGRGQMRDWCEVGIWEERKRNLKKKNDRV